MYETLMHIRVAFQAKAWADEKFCYFDALNVAADIRDAGITEEVCIGMDNHGAQRTPQMIELYEQLGLMPLFTPANCTDCTSPVDHHVGNWIQRHMRASYIKEVEKNPHIWMASDADVDIEDSKSNSAMQRRILMAKWLQDAWLDLIMNNRISLGMPLWRPDSFWPRTAARITS